MMKLEIIDFTPTNNYQENLNLLVEKIKNSSAKLILASEVIVTDFDYKNWDKANSFAKTIKESILPLSKDKIISLTIIENNQNVAYVFYNEKIAYKRAKLKLFGYEKKHFKIGNKIEIFEIEGIKFAILICFEIRFIEYWQKIKGVDIVLVPAMWGIERRNHLKTLSNALALTLQSFVVVSDGLAKASDIISPWAENLGKFTDIDLSYIKKIRKRLPLE
ncbi:MAG: carbon-nitrogen hydrolase family protein [Nautilia sp.]|nr:MAG: carbon-nitrogen hydrolase family protein [Nautilia sp.]